jgi:hypothetical protein
VLNSITLNTAADDYCTLYDDIRKYLKEKYIQIFKTSKNLNDFSFLICNLN